MSKKRLAIHLSLFVVVIIVIGFNAVLLYRMNNGGDNVDLENEGTPEVEITIVSSEDCEVCFDANDLLLPLRENDKVVISKDESYDISSKIGKELIEEYGITRLPTVLVNGSVDKVFDMESFLQNLGRQADDGSLIMERMPPPYLEVSTGAVKGKFTAIYLDDKSCLECYDVTLHKKALEGLLMKPSEENEIDISSKEGGDLLVKYNITLVPTLLLYGNLELFPQLQQIWPAIGTVENDGTFVFRQGLDQVGTYYDLEKDKVVEVDIISGN